MIKSITYVKAYTPDKITVEAVVGENGVVMIVDRREGYSIIYQDGSIIRVFDIINYRFEKVVCNEEVVAVKNPSRKSKFQQRLDEAQKEADARREKNN